MTRKNTFFEGWSWFKFNNLGLALATNLKFCTSVVKGLRIKFRKFQGLILSFVQVTEEKLVGEAPWHFRILFPSILEFWCLVTGGFTALYNNGFTVLYNNIYRVKKILHQISYITLSQL